MKVNWEVVFGGIAAAAGLVLVWRQTQSPSSAPAPEPAQPLTSNGPIVPGYAMPDLAAPSAVPLNQLGMPVPYYISSTSVPPVSPSPQQQQGCTKCPDVTALQAAQMPFSPLNMIPSYNSQASTQNDSYVLGDMT